MIDVLDKTTNQKNFLASDEAVTDVLHFAKYRSDEASSRSLSNQKRTENGTDVNRIFVAVAENDRKKRYKKTFEEILKNYPEMMVIFDELQALQKQLEMCNQEKEELLDENISLGEQLEETNKKLKINTGSSVEIAKMKNALYELQGMLNDEVEKKEKYIEAYQSLQKSYKTLQRENEMLKSKRGFFATAHDKAHIISLKNENNELKEKLQRVGRIPIENSKVKKIVQLYTQDVSHQDIAFSVGVAKSTVTKYIGQYNNGRLKHILGE